MHVLDQIHNQSKHAGVRLVIVGLHAQPLNALERAGKLSGIGLENLKPSMKSFLDEFKTAQPDSQTRLVL
jgi:hypothetical protein